MTVQAIIRAAGGKPAKSTVLEHIFADLVGSQPQTSEQIKQAMHRIGKRIKA